MTGYSRQSVGLIVASATITASALESEFAALATAFGAGGHDHSGSSNGGPVNLVTSITGTLPIANGGTAGTTASAARTALGLAIGTDVQAYDATLAGLAGLTITQSSLVYGTGTDAFAVLAKDTNATRYLSNTGTSNAPAWAQVALATGVSGTLPAANGGTGVVNSNTITLGGNISTSGALTTSGANSLTLTTTNTTSLTLPTTGTVLSTAVTAALVAGYTVTSTNAGTKSSGTFTPTVSSSIANIQYAVNGGAHTLAPPVGDGTVVIQYTNNGSAGTIATSGFTKVTGDSLTTVNGDDFMCYITVINGFSNLNIIALQ